MELGHQSPQAELGGAPVRFVKEIIRAGVYDCPGRPGEKVEISGERLEDWVRNFYLSPARVWVPYRHSADPEDNTGWVEDLFLDQDRLYAIMRITDERAAELLRTGTVRDVSVGVERDFVDMGGRRYDEVIRHVALTLDPHIRGQEGFVWIGSVAEDEGKGGVALEDSIYAYVDEATGEGHYPHHDEEGKVDLAAVRKALTDLAERGDSEEVRRARAHLLQHLREAGQALQPTVEEEERLELEARARRWERQNRDLRRRLRALELENSRHAQDAVEAEVTAWEAEGKVLPAYAPFVKALLAAGKSWKVEFEGEKTDARELLRRMFEAMPRAVEWGERLVLQPPSEKVPLSPGERRMLKALGIAEEDYRRLGKE